MLAPGLDHVAVTGDRLRTLENACLSTDKVKRDLLRALTIMYVVEVLIVVNAIYNTTSLSLHGLCSSSRS